MKFGVVRVMYFYKEFEAESLEQAREMASEVVVDWEDCYEEFVESPVEVDDE